MIKGSELAVIDDGAHMPNFECPERFNELVIDFIS